MDILPLVSCVVLKTHISLIFNAAQLVWAAGRMTNSAAAGDTNTVLGHVTVIHV